MGWEWQKGGRATASGSPVSQPRPPYPSTVQPQGTLPCSSEENKGRGSNKGARVCPASGPTDCLQSLSPAGHSASKLRPCVLVAPDRLGTSQQGKAWSAGVDGKHNISEALFSLAALKEEFS